MYKHANSHINKDWPGGVSALHVHVVHSTMSCPGMSPAAVVPTGPAGWLSLDTSHPNMSCPGMSPDLPCGYLWVPHIPPCPVPGCHRTGRVVISGHLTSHHVLSRDVTGPALWLSLGTSHPTMSCPGMSPDRPCVYLWVPHIPPCPVPGCHRTGRVVISGYLTSHHVLSRDVTGPALWLSLGTSHVLSRDVTGPALWLSLGTSHPTMSCPGMSPDRPGGYLWVPHIPPCPVPGCHRTGLVVISKYLTSHHVLSQDVTGPAGWLSLGTSHPTMSCCCCLHRIGRVVIPGCLTSSHDPKPLRSSVGSTTLQRRPPTASSSQGPDGGGVPPLARPEPSVRPHHPTTAADSGCSATLPAPSAPHDHRMGRMVPRPAVRQRGKASEIPQTSYFDPPSLSRPIKHADLSQL